MNKFEPNKPGVFENVPFDVYKAAPGVSKSMLDDFRDCPLKAYEKQQGLVKDAQTRAMLIGSLTDAAVFEPMDFRSKYYLQPSSYKVGKKSKKWSNNAKACKKWAKAHSDRPIITQKELDGIELMAMAVWKNQHAAELLRQTTFQVSLFAEHSKTGLLRKGRPDGQAKRFQVDLKKLADASTTGLSKAIAKYYYFVQAAYYMDLANANGFDVTDFYFIAVEPGERPKVNVRRLRQDAIDLGRFVYERDLSAFRDCHESGVWPGYSDANEIGYVDVPEGTEEKVMGETATIDLES